VTNLMMRLEAKESSRRAVGRLVESLEGRGEPPRGWTHERLAEDYLAALAGVPGVVIEAAAVKVRADRVRHTWPLAGELKKACHELMVDAPPPTAVTSSRAQAGIAAHEYVRKRLQTQIVIEATRQFSLPQLREWLWVVARDAIEAGTEPHVADSLIEAKLEELGAGITPAGSAPTPSDLGRAASTVVDRAREVRELEM
jgi:hypothetical protein